MSPRARLAAALAENVACAIAPEDVATARVAYEALGRLLEPVSSSDASFVSPITHLATVRGRPR